MSPEPRKLFLFRPTLGEGGADRVTLTLLEELDRSRLAPSLVLVRREGVLLGRVPRDVEVIDLGAGSLWTAWWPLARLLRHSRPEILFSTSGGANVTALVACLLAPRPERLVISERNVLFRRAKRIRRFVLFLLKRLLYARADEITVVSAGLKEQLARRLGLPRKRIRVVRNPVVTAELAELATAPANHPWLDDERPLLLAAGRLVLEKDFATLLRAFAIVRKSHPARLLVLGDGPLRAELERLAVDLGVRGDVDMPGFDRNPFRFMSRCRVFVLSSAFEGLPGVLIQAMACGAAVVATDCPTGPAEIVHPGRDGLLVPVGDPAAMAAAILALLEDPARSRKLGERARKASARFASAAALATYTAAILGHPEGAGDPRTTAADTDVG